MTIDENPREQPPFTVTLVANDGTILDQEEGTGKLILRRGAGAKDADTDVGTAAEPHDLADTDFESGAKNAGGAEALAGYVDTLDGNSYSIKVDWLDDQGNVDITDAPADIQSVATDVKFSLQMRSDSFELRIVDESGAAQNRVHGTANAH